MSHIPVHFRFFLTALSVPKVSTREQKRLFSHSSAYIETKIWEVFS